MSVNPQYGTPGVYRLTPISLADGQASALSVNERGELITESTVSLGATVFDLANSDALAVALVDSSGDQISSLGSVGLNLPEYDYVSMALSVGDTIETYTFKTGGSGGTTVATVEVVYTDNTRNVLVSVTKTTP